MDKIAKLVFVLICLSGFVFGQNNLSQKDFVVLKEPAENMMSDYLTALVDRQFATRDSLLSTLKSAGDWDVRAQAIRDSMISWTGPFPERTPLNTRVTGRIEREDYIIEKILIESRPNYFISANLYLPKNIPGPRPAHLNLIGHAKAGKADERYQRMSISQVKNGFVVLTIDQLGQGERWCMRYWHLKLGTQAFISGTHLFNIMVWDAMRALDYLTGRPEVDVEKVCVTGSSGGGMMTTYLLPFEDRITVAVPTCNPNTWSHRVHANLATDNEQVFFGAFASNIDPRGDPLFAHVPKPLLINSTTDDSANPARGVWELSTWLYKSYSAHGVPEKFTTSMVRAGHAYNQEQREITYAWMLRWTGNDASDLWEEDTPLEKEEDLWAATGGSVFNEPGSRRDQELVLDYLREHKARWEAVRTVNAVNDHKIEIAGLIEKVLNTSISDISVKYDIKETKSVGDINIRSYIIEPEAGIVLPGVLMESVRNPSDQDVILYMNEKGKSEIINEMDIVKGILDKGYRIFAVDLRGIGETSPDMSNKFWDFLAGKPIFGQRVRDVLAIVKWLQESEVRANNVKLWGTGMCSLYGAFAGAVNDDITGFVFEEPLISFESVVQVKVPGYNHEVLLPGILEKFDMPQVYQALCPRPVSLINPLLGDKTPAGESDIEIIDKSVLITYKGIKKQKNWSVQNVSGDKRTEIIFSLIDGRENLIYDHNPGSTQKIQ